MERSGFGRAPNISENIVMDRAADVAKSRAFAEAARGAYTDTVMPSACIGLSCRLPATNVPVGAAVLHSQVYFRRPPPIGFLLAVGAGAAALPVPATAKVSGTLSRKVAV